MHQINDSQVKTNVFIGNENINIQLRYLAVCSSEIFNVKFQITRQSVSTSNLPLQIREALNERLFQQNFCNSSATMHASRAGIGTRDRDDRLLIDRLDR